MLWHRGYQFRLTNCLEFLASSCCKNPSEVVTPVFVFGGCEWQLKLWLCLKHLHFTLCSASEFIHPIPVYKLRILACDEGNSRIRILYLCIFIYVTF